MTTDYGDLVIEDVDKEQVNLILATIFEEEEISQDSIWWYELVDCYNANVCGLYTGYKLSKILASYYVVMIFTKGSGAVTDGASVSNGHLSLSGINSTDGASVNLAKEFLTTIMGDCNIATIDVVNADSGGCGYGC